MRIMFSKRKILKMFKELIAEKRCTKFHSFIYHTYLFRYSIILKIRNLEKTDSVKRVLSWLEHDNSRQYNIKSVTSFDIIKLLYLHAVCIILL